MDALAVGILRSGHFLCAQPRKEIDFFHSTRFARADRGSLPARFAEKFFHFIA